MQCHGSYTAEGLQESFELDMQELSKQIARAAYRLANAGSTAYPAGLTYIAGSTPNISLDGGTHRTPFTTYLNGAPGTVGTTGYHPVLAKANWNFALLENDASKGVHNPSFTKKATDATIISVKGL